MAYDRLTRDTQPRAGSPAQGGGEGDGMEAPSSPKERRTFRRSVVGMPVQAVRRGTPADDPRRLVSLHVLNVSRGGVGAVTQACLVEREPVMLFFPPLGPGKGRDTPGRIVRCVAAADAYRVGIAFDAPWPEREEARTS